MKFLLLILIYLLWLIGPFFNTHREKIIEKNWADKIIYIFGWIFIPFYPIFLFFSLMSRNLATYRHTPLLFGKSWEEIRRRNFYLVAEILTFFGSLTIFFYFIPHIKTFPEKFTLPLIILAIFLLIFPTIFLFKNFEKYENSLSERNKQKK